MVFYTNLSNSIPLGTTAKSNVLTEKITSIFTQSTLFILSMIKKQLSVHNRKYNHFPMRPLNWHSHTDYINSFLLYGELF